MELDNVAVRLKTFIDSCGMTNSQFADRCGMPRPSLSQLLTGRNKKISDVIVGMIHQAFPQLSVLWLMFGEGAMLADQGANSENDENSVIGGFENEIFSENDTEKVKYPNLGALKPTLKPAPDRMDTEDFEDLKILELESKIEKMRKNPRKVSHITVYYDDSTFETFYPRR